MSTGIIKGNSSSIDNTLAFPIKPIKIEQSKNIQDEFNSQFLIKPLSRTSMYSLNENQASIQNNNGFQTAGNKYSNTDKYLKTNQNFQSTSIPDFSANNNTNFQKFESSSTGFNQNQPILNHRSPSQNSIRYDVDFYNKQAYKNALDQQVIEKELSKFEQKKANKKSELDLLSQYPFGRRTDPFTYLTDKTYYQPNQFFQDYDLSKTPFYREEPCLPKLNKNTIIEKPNSLSADIPPYDPIKHRNGFQQGYNYDPWGKPGGGAPIIDPNTGRKYTKISGQLGYDQIGMSVDERAKMIRYRPVTLEEQKYEMNIEKERKRQENENYKSKAGDVASWITGLESARLVHLNSNNGAHLPVTNVTREKINLESVRRPNEKVQNYHDELGRQLEERNRQTKLFKLKDDVAGIEHTKQWNSIWGKPGGGAPNLDKRRRDLTEVLESSKDKIFEGPLTSLPMSPRLQNYDTNTLFPKSLNKSNHTNLYDNITAMKL